MKLFGVVLVLLFSYYIYINVYMNVVEWEEYKRWIFINNILILNYFNIVIFN